VASLRAANKFDGSQFVESLSEAMDELDQAALNTPAEEQGKTVVFYAVRADALLSCLREAVQCGFHRHVIGTTGLDETALQAIKELADQGHTIVLAPNFSINAWLGASECAELACQIPDAEVEIIETHHNQKEDSPSGTALLWARAVVAARGQNFDEVVIFGRPRGKMKRTPEQVCIHSIRGGSVPGNHRAIFFGPDDEIAVEHNVRSGAVFARGALTAIRWATKKEESGLYGMPDVLDLAYLKALGVS